jgi:hypothetical protein
MARCLLFNQQEETKPGEQAMNEPAMSGVVITGAGRLAPGMCPSALCWSRAVLRVKVNSGAIAPVMT